MTHRSTPVPGRPRTNPQNADSRSHGKAAASLTSGLVCGWRRRGPGRLKSSLSPFRHHVLPTAGHTRHPAVRAESPVGGQACPAPESDSCAWHLPCSLKRPSAKPQPRLSLHFHICTWHSLRFSIYIPLITQN